MVIERNVAFKKSNSAMAEIGIKRLKEVTERGKIYSK